MASIVFHTDDSGARAKLQALAGAADNARPLYAAIGASLVSKIKLCFKLGIDPWGNPWQPIKWRAPRKDESGKLTKYGRAQAVANLAGASGQPLRDTGALQSSITAAPDASGVTVGTNQMPRAAALNFGATILPKKGKYLRFPGPNGEIFFAKKVVLPARPFLPLRRNSDIVVLPPAWSKDVTARVKKHLTAAVEKVA